MRNLFIILLSVYCLLPTSAQDTGEGQLVAKRIINGLFFNENPEPAPIETSVSIGQIIEKDGNKVWVTRYEDGVTLSEWAKSHAIPVSQVRNGKQLLEQSKNIKFIRTIKKAPGKPTLLKVGDKLPDFAVSDWNGRKWTNKDVLGKPMLLNFWYTGCKPCIREMPEMSAWTTKYPGVNYFACTWNTPDQIRKIVEKEQFTFIQLTSDEVLFKMFGINETPTTVLIDKKGVIRRVELGTTPRQRAEILIDLQKLEKE